MKKRNGKNNRNRSCPIRPKDGPIVYISEGQLCPNCSFARLIREPGNIIKCPVCGYGNAAGCT